MNRPRQASHGFAAESVLLITKASQSEWEHENQLSFAANQLIIIIDVC